MKYYVLAIFVVAFMVAIILNLQAYETNKFEATSNQSGTIPLSTLSNAACLWTNFFYFNTNHFEMKTILKITNCPVIYFGYTVVPKINDEQWKILLQHFSQTNIDISFQSNYNEKGE